MEAFSMEQSIERVDELVKEVFNFIDESAGSSNAYEMEKRIYERVMAMGQELLKGYFAKKGTGDRGADMLCEGHHLKRQSDLRGKDYFSIFGKFKIPRTYYHAKGCGGICPLDMDANLPKRCYSYLLQEWGSLLGLQDSFEESGMLLAKFFGLPLYPSRIEQIVSESGEDYSSFYEQKKAVDACEEGELAVIEFDGKGIPVIKKEAQKLKARLGKGEKRQKKKESMVGVSYTVDHHFRSAEPVAMNLVYPEQVKQKKQSDTKSTHASSETKSRDDKKPKTFRERAMKLVFPKRWSAEYQQKPSPIYKNPSSSAAEGESTTKKKDNQNSSQPKGLNIRRIASLERPKEEVVEEILNDFKTRNSSKARSLTIVMDGALGLWNMVDKKLKGIEYTGILDIIHVLEYIWEAGNSLFKEGSDEGKKWVYKQLLRILKGQTGKVIGILKQTRTKRKKLSASKQKTIGKVITYFDNHRKWMKYDHYLKKGLPIGSGVVESTCGVTVKNRMEGGGKRWAIGGAESVLRLRSIYTSQDWEEYWKVHMQLRAQNLYPDEVNEHSSTKNVEEVELMRVA